MEWISVKERLPDVSLSFLGMVVIRKGNSEVFWGICEVDFSPFKGWSVGNMTDCCVCVYYWTPRPEYPFDLRDMGATPSVPIITNDLCIKGLLGGLDKR